MRKKIKLLRCLVWLKGLMKKKLVEPKCPPKCFLQKTGKTTIIEDKTKKHSLYKRESDETVREPPMHCILLLFFLLFFLLLLIFVTFVSSLSFLLFFLGLFLLETSRCCCYCFFFPPLVLVFFFFGSSFLYLSNKGMSVNLYK